MTTKEIERQLKKILRCCENNRCRLNIIDDQLVLVDTRLDDLEADVLAIETDVADHETRIAVLEGASGGTAINIVANYSALPDPTTVTGEFYYAEASQGTAWLPGSLGGTYRKAGLYYSNGVTWLTDVNPWEATQADVDAGIITDQFVSPATLANANQWDTKNDSIQFQDEGVNLGTTGTVDTIDFVGSAVTAARIGNAVTVTVSGSSPSVISPAQITADQDDYNPVGFSTATMVRLDFDTGGRAITGFAAGTDGQKVTLSNISANFGYYPGSHPDSTAGNRILVPSDFIHYPYTNIDIVYDGTSAGWRIVGEQNTEGKKGIFHRWSSGSVTASENSMATWNAINAGLVVATASTTTLPASALLSTGTNTNGGDYMTLAKGVLSHSAFASSHISTEALISIPALSDGTETFTVELQLSNSIFTSTLEPNNLIGIRYSHGIAGGDWELFSQDNAGAESVDDLDVAVAAATLYKLRIEIDKAKTEARAYINNVYVGRVTANLPNSVVCGARVILLKSAGTTARTLNVHNFSAGAIYT